MGIESFERIEELFSMHGVKQIFVKHLALKQDNDKNQIYLGSGLDGITNIFPATLALRARSKSSSKSKSKLGKYIIEAKINLFWFHNRQHYKIKLYYHN